MPVQQLLYVTERVCITPLVEIYNPTFHESYRSGILRRYNERAGDLIRGRYLADCLLQNMKHGCFDGHHNDDLYQRIGFYLAIIHSGVLLPDGTQRPDVTSLVSLHDRQTRRGYEAGRYYYFLDARTEEERNLTDVGLIERVKTYAGEHMIYHESVDSFYFVIGNILGELSGRVFPWTHEEHRAFEEDCLKEVGYVEKLPEGCLAARLFTSVAVP